MESTYRLDINNPRIREAMKVLGIKKDDLLVRSFSDFQSQETTEQIQILRYEHYKQKLNGLVTAIQAFIKENNLEHQRSASSQNTRSSQSPSNAEKEKSRERHKSLLSQKIDEELKRRELAENTNKKQNRKSIVDERIKQEMGQKKQINENKKTAQEERLKLLMTEQIQQRKNWNSRANNHMSRSPKTNHDIMKDTTLTRWNEFIKTKEEREKKEEKELQEKMQNFNFKIVKSKELHEQMLKTKTEKMSSHTQRVESHLNTISISKEEKDSDHVKKIINKAQEHEEKREKILEENCQKWKNQQEKILNKQAKIKQNLIEEEKRERDRIRQIQNKLETSFEAIKQKKEELQKDLEYKYEKLKLKEEGTLENAAIKRRMDLAKKEKWLEKHAVMNKRLEELKVEKEKLNEDKRGKAYNAAIEKEKARKLQILIEKSSNPTVIKKLVENY